MMTRAVSSVAVCVLLALGLAGAFDTRGTLLPEAAAGQELDEFNVERASFGALIVGRLHSESGFFENENRPATGGEVSYGVYEGTSLSNLLSLTEVEDGDAEPPSTLQPSYVAMTLQDAVGLLRASSIGRYLVYYASESALTHAIENDRRRLRKLIEHRQIVAGVHGGSTVLREEIGLPTVANAEPDHEGGVLNLVRVNSAVGHLVTASVQIPPASSDEAQFARVFGDVDDWQIDHQRAEALAGSDTNVPDAWNSMYLDTSTRGYIQGFDPVPGEWEQVGSYNLDLTVYLLNASKSGERWYLLAPWPQVANSSYKNNHRRCGWTNEFLYLALQLEGGGSQIWDHMPGTTVSGASTSFRIGGSISQTGPSVSASFSESYGQPDLEITYQTDAFTQSWADWTFKIRGCARSITGWHGASLLAKTSYKGKPYLIIRTEPGQHLNFVLKAPVEQDNTTITKLSGFVGEMKVFKKRYFDEVVGHACEYPVYGYRCDDKTCSKYSVDVEKPCPPNW